MKKYAVAVANLYENTNELKIIEADCERKAIIMAVEDQNDSEFEQIMNNILEQNETLEDLIQYYWDGEFLVTKPVEI